MNRPISLQAALLISDKAMLGDHEEPPIDPSHSKSKRFDELLHEWDKVLGSVYGSRLDKRLAWDGISSRRELIACLEQAADLDNKTGHSKILEENIACIKAIRITDSSQQDLKGKCTNKALGNIDKVPFVEVLLPLLTAEHQSLEKILDTAIGARFRKESVIADLIADLARLLSQETAQVLYKEFNDQRAAETLIEAHKTARIKGDPYPRTSYLNFCRQCQKNIDELLLAYPVMAWRLAISLENWRANTKRVLQRIQNDWHDICAMFNWPTSGHITGMRFGEGDRHGRGQSVCILEVNLDAATSKKLVYKPRNMAIDLALNQCIDLANNESLPGRLKGVPTLNKTSHGYCMYVEHKACKSDNELRDFYFNFGRLTALLHCLGATDCHYENIIASGTDPILIDAETLFEPLFESDLKGDMSYPGSRLREKVDSSVMRTMVIPRWFYMSKNYQANELTALGVFNAEEQFELVPSWLAPNTDGMMPGQVKVPATVPNSLPVEAGTANPLSQYTHHFLSGFELQLSDICKNKKLWLSDHGGLFDVFKGVPRRLVFRSTSIYGGLLSQARTQENSRSFWRCGLVYESMARAFIRQEKRPNNWEIFHDECAQILLGDIPFFWSTCDGKEVLNYNNDIIAPSYIAKSGLDDAENRLRCMEQADIDFQSEIINGSFVSRFGADGAQLRSLQKRREDSSMVSPLLLKQLNHLADAQEPVRILRHLLLTSIPGEGSLSWLGAIVGPDLKGLSFGILDDTAAIGASGIGFYFALCCNAYPGLKHYAEPLALAAMRNFLTFFDQASSQDCRKWWIDRPSGLCGSGGTLQLFNSMDCLGIAPKGTRWESFREAAEEMLTHITPDDLFSQPFDDIYSGLSGLVAPLFNQGSQKAMEYSVEIGNEILRRQNAKGTWSNNNTRRSGFGHGNAGIAASLAFLYGKTKDTRFRDACLRAVEAENHSKSAESLGWHDLRYPPGQGVYTTMWCQGSSGIGLSRLIMIDNDIDEREISEDLDLAILAMLQATDIGIDDLCCGNSGVASVLSIVAEAIEAQSGVPWSKRTWPAADLYAKANQLLSDQVQGAHTRCHYRTMIPNGNTELLSLMTGLAGIGLSLVKSRVAHNARRSWLSCGMLPFNV